MALPAFKSLKLQLKNYIDNPFLGKAVAPHTQEILQFANQQIESSEKIARKMLLSSTSRLDLQIRAAVSKLLRKAYALKSINQTFVEFPTDQLEDLKRETLFFAEMLKKMAAAAAEEVPVAGEKDAVFSSRIGEPKMVGLSDQYKELKHKLTLPTGQLVPYVVVIVGMAGIGKTTLASKIFEDSDIVAHYDCRVWVTVGKKCKIKEIPRRILAAANDRILAGEEDDGVIIQRLKETLHGKRYLIVLDDVWNRYMSCQFIDHFESNSFESDILPWGKANNEGRVLITSRIQQQEQHDGKFPDHVVETRLLNEEESWDLLCKKVFGEDQCCPPQLEKDGKKIAENCKGLPLTIITVAELLSKEETTLQFWRAVAANKNHKIFMDAYREISKVLYSSYEELTHELRKCFLYLGIFPQEHEIPRSKLVNMWSIDGFLEQAHTFQNPSAIECLDELVSNSVVVIYQRNIGFDERVVGRHQVKTCGLHSPFWHISRKIASETKFCHVINILSDCSDDYLQGQNRLSFHNNILFGVKDVHVVVESMCASSARSLLCYGPYHQYQVPLCYGLNSLQEIDALTIRLYEFPQEVLQLVKLKYLALTLNGELPSSISKLSKLQFLIVGRHTSIKSSRTSSYLPVEIWDMRELKHLQVRGNDLPKPRDSMENLSTLLDVSGQSWNEGVVSAIPNLKKLGIRVELGPDDIDGMSLSCLNHICHLEKLQSLKCVILNPDTAIPLAPISFFPKNLRKLSLSGLGCSWSEMSKISCLLYLEVLKLRNYAFVGPTWEVSGKRFDSLKSLVIEDTDLEEWRIGSESLTHVESLRIKHCYELERISWISDRPRVIRHWACHNSLKEIELVDCNHLGVEEMDKALPPWKKDALAVHSSWKDRKLKT